MHAVDLSLPKQGKRIPGRPKGSIANHGIAQRLINVTDLLLRKRSHLELTEREIAEASGVSEKMIHYYFGDKNGLILDIVTAHTDVALEKTKALMTIDPWEPFITRKILNTLIDIYYAKPWLHRVMATEHARTKSSIVEGFKQRYGLGAACAGCGTECGAHYLQGALDRLVEMGIYDSRANTRYIALTIFSLIAAPYMQVTMMSPLSRELTLDERKKDEWLDFLTELFECQLLRPKPELPVEDRLRKKPRKGPCEVGHRLHQPISRSRKS